MSETADASGGHVGRVLVTGATGYVGGRLVKTLELGGVPVRCLARKPRVLDGRVDPATEVVAGDVYDEASLDRAMAGISCAYYLIHALGESGNFEERELTAARNFARAARAAGVQRIIYLGGLSRQAVPDSPHMRSRVEVGRILRESGVPTIEFRASIIIGSGSLSFELVRALVHRLPVMIAPRWVSVEAQPIAILDVVAYLHEALTIPLGSRRAEGRDDIGAVGGGDSLTLPEGGVKPGGLHASEAVPGGYVSRVYEIGGAERVSYGGLIQEYARQRGLRRFVIGVPVLTPRLSSLWLSLVTPVYAQVGRKLIASMTHPSTVEDATALADFSVRPVGVAQAIDQAIRKEDREFAETHWCDALSSVAKPAQWGGVPFGSRILDSRSITVAADETAAFAPIRRIGGRTGWYYGDALWQVRGVMDRAFGGVGMRRGRRDPEWLRGGDVVDCWRVEAIEPPHRLLLAAEMRLPGRAWLQFEVQPSGGRTEIRQTALFDPSGLSGVMYWYALYPFHEFIFRGMLRRIGEAAEREAPTSPIDRARVLHGTERGGGQ